MEATSIVPGQQATPRAGRLAGARIFIVEDEFLIAMQLQSIFEEEGAAILGPYHSLTTALRDVATEDFTAALLDVNLGKDVATPIADILARRGIPFMFYSVQTADPALSTWGHVRIIQKPAVPNELVEGMVLLTHGRQAAE